MALHFQLLKKLEPYIRGKKVLSLGYPDLLASIGEIEKGFGYKPQKFTNANQWHGLKDKLPETLEFFERLESKLTVVDFTKDHGMEIIADLNYPQDFGEFDLVIDPGTLEHCFNIGQAFLTAASSVKVGGAIFHISPMTMLNHGFYNLNPTLFHDFYVQNGWEISEMKIVPSHMPQVMITKRFDTYVEHTIRVLALRKKDGHLKMPIQTKYLEKLQATGQK